MSTIQHEHYHILLEWLLDDEIETADFVKRADELCVPADLVAIALEYTHQFQDLAA